MRKIDTIAPNTRKVVIEIPKTTEYILVQHTYFDENGSMQAGIDSFRLGKEDDNAE